MITPVRVLLLLSFFSIGCSKILGLDGSTEKAADAGGSTTAGDAQLPAGGDGGQPVDASLPLVEVPFECGDLAVVSANFDAPPFPPVGFRANGPIGLENGKLAFNFASEEANLFYGLVFNSELMVADGRLSAWIERPPVGTNAAVVLKVQEIGLMGLGPSAAVLVRENSVGLEVRNVPIPVSRQTTLPDTYRYFSLRVEPTRVAAETSIDGYAWEELFSANGIGDIELEALLGAHQYAVPVAQQTLYADGLGAACGTTVTWAP